MSDRDRCGPATGRIHTDSGPFFEADLVGLLSAGADPLRDCGRILGRVFERCGFYRVEPAGPLERAAEALRRDVSRLEAVVERVTAGDAGRDGLAQVLRWSGFLLRRMVRELADGRRRLDSSTTEDDFQDV